MPQADILPPHLVLPETSTVVASSRGVNVAITDWGTPGDARPILVMAHATGLHGHAWLPTVLGLGDTFRCVAIDQRAQGDTTSATVGGLKWEGVADDIEIAMGALGLLELTAPPGLPSGAPRNPVYGIGHSQGGFAVLEVERRRPGTFAGLFVWEPVVFPYVDPAVRAAQDNMMSTLARKRRRSFPSWQAAVDNYRGKGPFALVDEDLLRCYVYWGFVEQPDGSVELKCAPEHEAELFEMSSSDLFDNVAGITCPTTVALGSLTNDGFAGANPLLADHLPNGRLVRFEGRTHFGVYEGSHEIASIVATALLDPTTALEPGPWVKK